MMMFAIRQPVLWPISRRVAQLGPGSQVQSQSRAPVGVALSGGGALGLAHVGVLRYFEEHHIPIDKIAGTSMGGLVGGFYATGMDAHQLEQVLEEADRDALLKVKPRFEDLPIAKKREWNRTFGNKTSRSNKRFSLPSGVNTGVSVSLLLNRSTIAYSDVTDFDELPIPFRCVATNLVSGDAVVLRRGSLTQAMRATMSLPAVFTPVRMEGMVLVDGGLVDKVPVNVVREMGAQTVIAVAFKATTPTAEELETIPVILRQAASIAISQNERRSLRSADLVIEVDAKSLSGWDYSNWREIIQAGYEAAQARASDLKPLETSPEEWDRHVKSRKDRMRPDVNSGHVVSVSAQSDSQGEPMHWLRRLKPVTG